LHSSKETVPHLLRRHRKGLASAALGLWLFALFLGIAHACSWDGATTVSHTSTMSVHASDDAMGDDQAPDCEDLPGNGLPLSGVLQLVQEPPAGVAMLVETHREFRLWRHSASLSRRACRAHPPPGVPFADRIVRLTL
jgi:hypothetical protein